MTLSDSNFFNNQMINDSRDYLECFGEFSSKNTLCLKYCSDSIQCAIEHEQNPSIDMLEHFLTMEFDNARIN